MCDRNVFQISFNKKKRDQQLKKDILLASEDFGFSNWVKLACSYYLYKIECENDLQDLHENIKDKNTKDNINGNSFVSNIDLGDF